MKHSYDIESLTLINEDTLASGGGAELLIWRKSDLLK